MGASRWHYIVPYHKDPSVAYEGLRQKIFREMTWVDPKPATIEELMEIEFIEAEGTHSALDLDEVVGVLDEDDDDEGVVRRLSDSEATELFGSSTPTRAVFEKVYREASSLDFPPTISDSGCYTILFDENHEPSEFAFWGLTGA